MFYLVNFYFASHCYLFKSVKTWSKISTRTFEFSNMINLKQKNMTLNLIQETIAFETDAK